MEPCVSYSWHPRVSKNNQARRFISSECSDLLAICRATFGAQMFITANTRHNTCCWHTCWASSRTLIFFLLTVCFSRIPTDKIRGVFLREMLDWRGSLSAWPPMISIRKTRSKTLHNGLCVYRQTSCNPQSHNTAKQNSRIYISEFTVWSMECSLIGRWL